jgi:Calcineurin-like phosphoesterase
MTPRKHEDTLIAVGDLHLGRLDRSFKLAKAAGKSFPEGQTSVILVDDLVRTLRSVRSAGKAKRPSHVVFLGDVFDKPEPAQWLVAALLKMFQTMSAEATFHVLLGNHDWAYDGNHALLAVRQASLPNVNIITEPTSSVLNGHKFFFCPHPFVEDQPKDCLASFGHFAWAGARMDNGVRSMATNSPKGQWLLGDFHGAQEGERFAYAGSFSKLTFGEATQPKSIMVVKPSSDGVEWARFPCLLSYDLARQVLTKTFKPVKGGSLSQNRSDGTEVFYEVVAPHGSIVPAGFMEENTPVRKISFDRATQADKPEDKGAAAFDSLVNLGHYDNLSNVRRWLRQNTDLTKEQRAEAAKLTTELLKDAKANDAGN